MPVARFRSLVCHARLARCFRFDGDPRLDESWSLRRSGRGLLVCVGYVILAHCSIGRCGEALLSVTTFHRLEIFIEARILILHNEGGLHPERSG